MTDSAEPSRVSRRSIHLYAWTGLLFSGVVVGLTTRYGDPANTMHASAQAWGFSIFALSLLIGVGALAYADRLGVLKR